MRKKKRNYLKMVLMLAALSLIFILTSTAVAQCPVDITSLWTLDESSGSFLADAVNGNNGTGAADPQPTTEGIVSGAQIFNGNTTGINIPADNSFNWAQDSSFSIEYWVKRAAGPFDDNEVVVGRDDASSQLHWWTGLWSDDGTASFVLISTNGDGSGSRATGEWLEGITDVADGQWHHIVVVRDGGLTENRLYVDTVEEDSTPIIHGAGFDSATSALNLGWLNLSGGFYFEGTADEIAIYDRVLTPQEISDHFNGRVGVSYCGTLARHELTVNPAPVNGTVNPPGGVYFEGRALEVTPVPDAGNAFDGWGVDLTGFSNPANLVMDAAKTISAAFAVDVDSDGISDALEDAGLNSGDGNSDSIQDSIQAYVAAIPTADGQDFVTLEVDNLFTLANCRAVTPPTSDAPTGIDFSYGFFAFDIGLTNSADSPQAKLFLPAGADPSTYYKFGPTPADNSDHWYEFLFDGQTGADVSGNPVIIDFANGVRGDDDLDDTNLVIKDAGGPGSPLSSGGGGGGGG